MKERNANPQTLGGFAASTVSPGVQRLERCLYQGDAVACLSDRP